MPAVRIVLLAFLAMLAPATSQAAAQTQDVRDRIAAVENGLVPIIGVAGRDAPMTLAERMSYYGVPGVSVAVVNNSRIEWAKGYGVLEADHRNRVDSTTMFQAASLSKPISALAALHLVHNGRLDLDRDANEILASWKVPKSDSIPNFLVTVRGLLSHTSGLTPTGYTGYEPGTKVPTLIQVLNGQRPANTTPISVDELHGQGFHYSGGGYTILQQIFLDLTSEKFPVYMQRTILGPLEMNHSTYEQPLPKKVRKFAASGHRSSGRALRGHWNVYPEQAAAGLWTTPSDVARFAIEIQQAAAGRSAKVIPQSLVTEMLTPQRGGPVGLGLFLRGSGGAIRFGHSGANEGFRSEFVAFVHHGMGAVVMTNSDTGGGLLSELINAIAAVYRWPDYSTDPKPLAQVDPRIYDRYVGDYEVAPNVVFTVTREGDRLFLRTPDHEKAPVFLESETDFFLTMADERIGFLVDGHGSVTGLVLRHGGAETRAVKKKG
ncbi:MAG: serine hydrolase [Gemmatimonadetes bacterium]|nr:serine hydrolase [Gemmatimonadota bacterium]